LRVHAGFEVLGYRSSLQRPIDSSTCLYITLKFLMLDTLTPAQQELAEYMSQLSEQAYAAGWIEGLEYALWKALVEGPYNYGCLLLTDDHVRELKRLSEACGGWICFLSAEEETFVPFQQWQSALSQAGRCNA
jgi:hypothetical protein